MAELYYLYRKPHYLVHESALKDLIISAEDREKKLLIVLNQAATAEQALLLAKILGAVQFDSSQYIVVQHSKEFKLNNYLRNSAIKQTISFGCSSSQLGIQCEAYPYRRYQLADQEVLFSHGLSDLDNQENKKALWNALKQMFAAS